MSDDIERGRSIVDSGKHAPTASPPQAAQRPLFSAPSAPLDESDNDKKPRNSIAAKLVRMARDDYTLGVTDTGEPFGVHQKQPHIARMLRGGKTGLRQELSRRYFDDHKIVPSQQALADAGTVLEGYAQQTTPRPVYLRVAQDDGGGVYIDMGDTEGHVIEITGGQWHIETAAPVLFRRTKLTGEMPKPVAGGNLSRLWHFVPIAEEDRPLVLAWLVAALIQPNVAHTVLALLAEHGSAKSTMTRCLVDLIDPSSVPVRKAPRDAEGWVTAANASWVVALDNLSGAIALWFSDCLCRASTGDGDVRRQLYTDNDVSVISFRRVVAFNGIDVIVTQGDLADRLLRVQLPRIIKRIKEGELAVEWADAQPHILGGLLDLAADVHRRLSSLVVEDLPRMADFALVLAAVDEALGTKGLARYRQQCKRLAADTLGDAFIAELVGRRYCCTDKTSAEILDAIETKIRADWSLPQQPWRPPRGWPRNARDVTAQLTRHAPAMRAQGWTVEDDGGQNKRHATSWWIEPPPEEEKAGNPGSPSSRSSPSDDNPTSDGTDDGELGGNQETRPTSPTSPTSPNEARLTSRDELASQASYPCTPSLVLCRYCGVEIAEHMTSARARGHCGKARCINAANEQTGHAALGVDR